MLEEGKILQGRYLIARKIGEGGMGAVYMATDQRLDNIVALKETLVNDESLLRAFEREARLLAGLRHPALTKVSDHFTEGGCQYLVMDFISGDDLAAVLDKRRERIAPIGQPKPFTQDEVLNWGDQLLDALDYLHSHEPPVVHRDIKPQNLKITERNQVILLDFGLAKGSATQTTQMKSIFGYTPTYAPLEQMEGSGTDPRSDLYSLAATLYHLVTGQTPPDALKRVTMTMSNQPDPLLPANQVNSQVSRAVASVLAWAMSLRSDERPASARAFRRALKDARQASATAGGAERTPKTTAPGVSPPATQTPPQNSRPQPPAQTTNPQPPAQKSWPPPASQVSPPPAPQASWPPPAPQQSWPPSSPQQSWPPQSGQQSWPPQSPQQSWPPQSPQQSWPPSPQTQTPQQSWPPPAPARWPPPPVTQPPYQQPAQKSNKALWIILGVLAFVIVVGLILLATTEGNTSKSTGSNASSTTTPKPDSPYPASPGTSSTPPPSKPSDNATGATMEPRIEETLTRYVEALGGRAAAENLTSRVAKGSLEMPDLGVTGTVESYAKAPNKLVLIMNLPGLGVSRTGFNGSVGWSQEMNLVLRQVEGAELASMKREADFYREIRLKELFPTMSFQGKQSADGRDTYVIEATPPEGGSEKWYFDAQSGLMIRSDVQRASAQGLTTTESHFEQYRTVDGIQIPTVLRQSLRQATGVLNFVIRLKEIRHNVPIDDAIFNMPSK